MGVEPVKDEGTLDPTVEQIDEFFEIEENDPEGDEAEED